MIRIGVIVLVRVGGCFRRSVNTARDLSNLRVRRVVHRVISRRGTVRVNLRTLSDLINRRQIRCVCASVLNTYTVCSNHSILDTADMGVQIRIGINRSTRSTISIRSRRDTLIQRTGIVVDTADLLLRGRGNRDRIAAAVDSGDIAEIYQNLICTGDLVALADQVDGRRVVISGVHLCVVSINNGTRRSRGSYTYNIQDVGLKGPNGCSAVIKNSRIRRTDRIAGQSSQMSAVIQSIGRRTGNGIVIHHTYFGGCSGICDRQVAAVILCCSKLGCT